MTNRSPTLLKWPFILADVLLLAVSAWIVLQVLPYRTTGAYIVAAVAILAWIVGAFICVWPWLAEFKAQTQHLQNDTLVDALKQIERLEEIGARVQSATASWQTAQDSALRVTQVAKEIEERIKTDSKDFMEFAERINSDEKQNLRLEVEKLRRTEAEWLQVAARMLDHTFALTAAAVRSGQPNLVAQMTNFQNACRDAARRVGLIPFHPAVGEAFDGRSQQLEDPNAKPAEGAVISDILATGFTFQGQLLRKALVRVASGEPQTDAPTESLQETPVFEPASHQEQTEVAEPVGQVRADEDAEPQALSAEQSAADTLPTESSSPEPSPQPEAAAMSEERFVEAVPIESSTETSIDTAAEIPAPETPAADTAPEEDKPRRRQRKPDPQTSLPF